MKINGKEYELVEQTSDEKNNGACGGCAFQADSKSCHDSGVDCVTETFMVYKEVK